MQSSKDLFTQHREETADQWAAPHHHTELQQTEPHHYCTHCEMGWTRLRRSDADGDEQYEVCPLCNNDSWLELRTDGEVYMYCEITGAILNVFTREQFSPPSPIIIEHQPPPVNWAIKPEEYAAKEDKALAAYFKAIDEGKDGKAEFFETLNEDL